MASLTKSTPAILTLPIEAKSKTDDATLVSALAALAAEDPSFHVAIDAETRQIVIGGSSELHLDIKVDRLRRTSKIDIVIGAPQVAYRETLTKRIEKDYTYRKQTGGTSQFARVRLIFEPNEAGAGLAFESTIVGGSVPKGFIPGVEKGINSVGPGVLAGFPVVDVKATLIDGAFHDVDSSVLTFEIASRAAFREALREGGSVLLEPIMSVEVTTPEDYIGSVRGDLIGRRGEIEDQEMCGDAIVIKGMVPFANLFGYTAQLRSFSQGRASFTMQFAFYQRVDPAPPNLPRFPPAAVALRVA